MYPRFRPQAEQRRTTRDLNFGALRARMIIDFRAIFYLCFVYGAVSPRIGDLSPL